MDTPGYGSDLVVESNVVRNRGEQCGERRPQGLGAGLSLLVEASYGVECWYTRAVAGSIPAAPTSLTRGNGAVQIVLPVGRNTVFAPRDERWLVVVRVLP